MPPCSAPWPWPPLLPGALVAGIVVTAASAAALGGTTPDGLASGQASVAPCDPDGFTVSHVLSGSTVTDVHRITGGSAAEGFVTTGDNRSYPDPWRPREGNIAGREWITVPGAGLVLVWLRSPLFLSLLVCVLVYALVLSALAQEPALDETPRWRHAAPSTRVGDRLVSAIRRALDGCRPRERRHRRHRIRRGTHFRPRRPRPISRHRVARRDEEAPDWLSSFGGRISQALEPVPVGDGSPRGANGPVVRG